MPGLQGEEDVASLVSPIKRSKLSLKFFQKKETKRALDFSEPQADDTNCDQVVPAQSLQPSLPDDLPLSYEKSDVVLPFVGLSNGGNTCYLNSILQVLYHCPGLKEGIKSLYKLSISKAKPTEETKQSEERARETPESFPAQIELLANFHSLIRSVEQLQSDFLLNTDSFSERELDTSPREVLKTLRQLNPMYEGYFQHDAQEVLQCILGYIQEACKTIRTDKKQEAIVTEVQVEHDSSSGSESQRDVSEDGQVAGKRKSDTEMGNAKKKPKSGESGVEEEHLLSAPVTRSKSKSFRDNAVENTKDKAEEKDATKELGEEGANGDEKTFKEADGRKKKRCKLGWLRPAEKQPSIMSMFRTVGKLTSTFAKISTKAEQGNVGAGEGQTKDEKKSESVIFPNGKQVQKAPPHQDGLDLMEHLFHGQLLLRTRCLECESFSERREDFQDISVPVQEEQPSSSDDLSSVSPYPKPEKTLKWAIGQFASVERISGEDKYFCDTCRHYAEAERSLLFDKTPEIVTIHLKRFSASSSETDPYVGLSKVNTPLQTPLTLSLEEWCMPRSSSKGHDYELFAVVMHSGVSIGSGHYTAYVRMSGLKDAKFWLCEREQQNISEEVVRDDDDGEVSIRRDANQQPASSFACGKPGSKKRPEGGVGLLGGQRSRTSVEHEERVTDGGMKDESEQRKTIRHAKVEPKKEAEAGEERGATSREEEEASEQQALKNLLEYEGKWLLFDDSEVHLVKEEDFIQACSPQTCSSSTPYLLFYKRIPESGH
ncbi:ubiquitin carboxyl-terminal hydrolase 1 [Hippocampus zosterae]|uniref:ubiquitin carboxyl-terminal hydrolase 1 n=1 Tax=Hippocampus zosterae TaxID=109293 RepID=UPI00223D2B45|nr:ubiquitin carboxyl-terminal hydrolase 1 [Hippocampus zosterae]XP_051929349.1 ubiquitin carboxyl-terminal hydrolase 1 [Hippocampus zosterae]